MKSTYWYGYLDAGKKSSFVARDLSLDTGDPETIYLFNQSRGEIKEYKREIVEPKLRELNAKEANNQKTLEKELKAALAQFCARTSNAQAIPERKGTSSTSKSIIPPVEEELVTEIESGDDIADDEWDEDEN